MKFVECEDVEKLIENSIQGNNTKFLKASHSLWKRFHNYEKQLPMGLQVGGAIVALIFATFNRDKYTNLYEIVTLQGHEGKGYASKLWSEYIRFAVNEKGSERLKISCTPSSITWHLRNGLIFWAVDPSGSLRSDQKLFDTREKQIAYRNEVLRNPIQALPPNTKVKERLMVESIDKHGFGVKKTKEIEQAISNVGNAWLRDSLFAYNKLF